MSVGGFVHSHRLYSERGGRQIAAPTVSLVGQAAVGIGYDGCFIHKNFTFRSIIVGIVRSA